MTIINIYFRIRTVKAKEKINDSNFVVLIDDSNQIRSSNKLKIEADAKKLNRSSAIPLNSCMQSSESFLEGIRKENNFSIIT